MFHSLRHLHPRSLVQFLGQLDHLVKTHLWAKVLAAIVAGVSFGILCGPALALVPQTYISNIGNWLSFPGQLFIGTIQMIVVPLIFASIIRGLASTSDIETLKRLSWKLSLYFLATTTIAVCIGLAVNGVMDPAQYISPQDIASYLSKTQFEIGADQQAAIPSSFQDVLSQVLPTNPLSSMVEQNMLQIVVFAIIMGIALLGLPSKQAAPLIDLLGSIQRVCMTIVGWAMRLAPYAVFGMIFNLTVNLGLDLLIGMGMYCLTVLVGLLILGCVYLLIAYLVVQVKPGEFLRKVRSVQLLAFSTSSSAAVMPLTTQTVEKDFGVRPSMSQFIVPLGATVNMDGTALYQTIAAMFLISISGIDLPMGQTLLVTVSIILSSIGAPSAPGVGIVLLATILNGVGVPMGMIALIMGVDRILDMSRTTINVTGDITASLVMDKWVPASADRAEEVRQEQERENVRRQTGSDVVVTDT